MNFDFLKFIEIIQGGMGVNISTFLLARIVSLLGGLGTVSGVALERVLACILQKGDPDGHCRRAMAQFPHEGVAERILKKYYVEGGIGPGSRFKPTPIWSMNPSKELIELACCAAFVIVYLAKEGHDKPISINLLEKIQRPIIFYLYGAMLAGADVVTMGAGLPSQIPDIFDKIIAGESLEYRLHFEGDRSFGIPTMNFNPGGFFEKKMDGLKRPALIPIVSSDAVARIIFEKTKHRVEGFAFEGNIAGGHNASPREKPIRLNDSGEPLYNGKRDVVDFEALMKIGPPVWIGGGMASPQGLKRAKQLGARGIQVGSAFALSRESGLRPDLREIAKRLGSSSILRVFTSMCASPTGFPFKVAQIDGTQSDPLAYTIADANRHCDKGYLGHILRMANGNVVTRCPAEDIEHFIGKGGDIRQVTGSVCLCKALLAAAGFGDPGDIAIVTLGDDLSFLGSLMKVSSDYSAQDVMEYLQGPCQSQQVA